MDKLATIMNSALAFVLFCSASPAQAQDLRGWAKTQLMRSGTESQNFEAMAYPNTAAVRGLTARDHEPAPGGAIVKEFSPAEIEIDFPESYESLLEQDIRKAINSWLEAEKASAPAAQIVQAASQGLQHTSRRMMILSFDVTVAADYWAPVWRSPVYIVPEYSQPGYTDHPYLHSEGVALEIDPGVNDVQGSPRLTVRMFLEEDGARVWAGFAGAPVRGASRSQIGRALGVILAERIGRTTDDERVDFEPSGAPSIKIVDHGAERSPK